MHSPIMRVHTSIHRHRHRQSDSFPTRLDTEEVLLCIRPGRVSFIVVVSFVARLPPSLGPSLPACLLTWLAGCLPGCLPACLPASFPPCLAVSFPQKRSPAWMSESQAGRRKGLSIDIVYHHGERKKGSSYIPRLSV